MGYSRFWEILCFSLLAFSFFSCDNNDDKYGPIELVGTEITSAFKYNSENSTIHLSPFNTDGVTLKIIGGDGKYSIVEGDDLGDIASLSYNGEIITLKSKGIGYSILSIKDESQNSLMLRIQVQYPYTSFGITNASAYYVVGDNLTVKQKKEIEEDIKPSYPIKSGGGYRFIYTTAEYNEGKVQIHPDRLTSGQFIEGTFTVTNEEIEIDGYNIKYERFNIETEDKTLVICQTHYIYDIFNKQRAVGPPQSFMFWEDQTDSYKEEYPEVEKAFAIQIGVWVNE